MFFSQSIVSNSYMNDFNNQLSLARQYAALHSECMTFHEGKPIPRFDGVAFDIYEKKLNEINKRLVNYARYYSISEKEIANELLEIWTVKKIEGENN